MKLQQLISDLETAIKDSYESGVVLDEAEKLAAKTLYAMMQISSELKKEDLDCRMKRAGLKAVKARAYVDSGKSETKLTEAGKEAYVNQDETVSKQQDLFDQAEATREDLERMYNIFKEAHVYYRGIAKGRFE